MHRLPAPLLSMLMEKKQVGALEHTGQLDA